MTDSREHDTTRTKAAHQAPTTLGRVLHSALSYDLLAWTFLRGRESAFRQRIIDLARLRPGSAVLDVGCGTGTLAILAKKHTGPTAAVHGIDASPEMIARARRKAKSAGVDVAFENAVVEALPFPDGTFDVVLSTLMLHHLPRGLREQAAREIRRVLKRGGRLIVVDFGPGDGKPKGFLSRLHRHGRVNFGDVVRVLTDAGLSVAESAPMGVKELQFVIATAP
jgi:ubiquinone/menaquinone biosynthesis C-methylase UbiE